MKLRTRPIMMQLRAKALLLAIGREEEGMGVEMVGGQQNMMRDILSRADDTFFRLEVLARVI